MAFSGFLLSLQSPSALFFPSKTRTLSPVVRRKEMDGELAVNAAPQPKGWLQTPVRQHSQTKSLD